MCCTPPRDHGMKMMESGTCCCQSMHGQESMFLSKQKKIILLQKHLDHLKEEVKDLEDYMAELQKEK